MANPFQEQLLKAGLVSKQKVRDTKTQKRRDRKAKVDDGSEGLKQEIATPNTEKIGSRLDIHQYQQGAVSPHNHARQYPRSTPIRTILVNPGIASGKCLAGIHSGSQKT